MRCDLRYFPEHECRCSPVRNSATTYATGPSTLRASAMSSGLGSRLSSAKKGVDAFSSLRSSGSYAIAQVNYSGAETARLKEFETPSQGRSECRLSAAH